MNKLKREFSLHAMIFPGVLSLIIFSYIPMSGILIAFLNYTPIGGFEYARWIGWLNFKYILDLPNTFNVLRNTIFIASMQIVAGLLVPIVVSLLLNEMVGQKLKRVVQTIIYLPHFLSWVILGGVMFHFLSLHGLINRFLSLFLSEPIYFLGNNQWFPFVLVISNVWKEFGFSTIVYLAALTSINPSLYEAAVVDGAGRWKKMWYITLPGILPFIVMMSTLSIGNLLNAGFEQILVLYSPIVYDSGDVIDTLIYRLGLVQTQYGPATAFGLFRSVMSFVLISTAYYLAYRWANYRIF